MRIDELRGRELDAAVAEAMGETTARGPDGRWTITGGHGDARALPRYSTDIAAAWTVVERCTALDGFGYREARGLPVATWFMAHFESSHLWASSGPEAAEAICRMALRAVAGERVARPGWPRRDRVEVPQP